MSEAAALSRSPDINGHQRRTATYISRSLHPLEALAGVAVDPGGGGG